MYRVRSTRRWSHLTRSRSSWSHPPNASVPTRAQNGQSRNATPHPQRSFAATPRLHRWTSSPTETWRSSWPASRSSSVLPLRSAPPTNRISTGFDRRRPTAGSDRGSDRVKSDSLDIVARTVVLGLSKVRDSLVKVRLALARRTASVGRRGATGVGRTSRIGWRRTPADTRARPTDVGHQAPHGRDIWVLPCGGPTGTLVLYRSSSPEGSTLGASSDLSLGRAGRRVGRPPGVRRDPPSAVAADRRRHRARRRARRGVHAHPNARVHGEGDRADPAGDDRRLPPGPARQRGHRGADRPVHHGRAARQRATVAADARPESPEAPQHPGCPRDLRDRHALHGREPCPRPRGANAFAEAYS